MTKRWLRSNCWPILNFQQGPPFSYVGTFYFARKSRSWINTCNNKALLTFKGWLLSRSSLKTRKENMSLLNKEKMRKTKKRKYDLLCDKENTTQGATAGKKAHKVDLWEIKSQSGFGVPKRDAAIIRQAAAVSVRKFLELLKICQKSRNLSKTPFPVLLRLLAVCRANARKKNSIFANLRDLLQICTVAHWTSPSHHLFRMEAKNDDRSSSFAEKSGGSALRNQGLHSRKFTLPCQPGTITTSDQLDRHIFTLFSHSFKWILCKRTQKASPQTKILLRFYICSSVICARSSNFKRKKCQ